MMRPRWQKVLTDLWGNRVRSILVIASIAVGLFAVGLIANMHAIITADMETGYAAVNPANIQVSGTPFEQDTLDHIHRISGVAQAEGAAQITLRVRNRDQEWEPIEIKAIPDIEEMEINLMRLDQGQWPPADRTIVVDRYKLENLGIDIGGEVEIETPSGKVRRLTLTGVVQDQTIGNTGAGGFFLSPVQGYITYETLTWLEQPQKMNTLYVTVEGDRNNNEYLRDIANQVSDEFEQAGGQVVSTALRASNDHPNRVYVQAIAAVLILLGFLVMFLSTFLITNTLSALLNQQVQQIGVMKTIGARRGQIMAIYMILIFIFGLIAFAISVPLSSRAAYALLEYLAGEINMELQGFRLVPYVVVIQLIGALVVPEAAGFLPILHGTRISAVEAQSGYNQSNPPSNRGWLDRQLKRIRRLPRPTLLSLRNTFRRKGRLFLTLFTLTLAGAIFIGTFNVQRSLNSYIDRIGRYFLADVNISLKQNYRVSEISNLLLQIPGVGAVEGWAAARGQIKMPDGTTGESVNILAPPSNSPLVEPMLQEGRWLQPGDERVITVNERFRDLFPNIKLGDTIQMDIYGDEVDLTVVGFFQMAGKSSGYLAYTNYDYLSRQIHAANQSSTFRVTADRPGLTAKEQEALGWQIEDHLNQRGISVAEVSAGHSLTSTTADGLNILTAFLLIMALLIAAVGSIGLAGTMSMNVLERTREIGIMRAIGATNRAIMNQVLVEGLLIGLMSWGLGVALSFPIGTLMSNALNLALFGAPVAFTFTPTGVILWLFTVLVLSALASMMPARSAARLTIREVLAYE